MSNVPGSPLAAHARLYLRWIGFAAALLLIGCEAQRPALPPPPSRRPPTATVGASPSPAPTRAASAVPAEPTLTEPPLPSATPAPTSTPSPTIAWSLPAVEIAGWPPEGPPEAITWDAGSLLTVSDGQGRTYTVDPQAAQVTAVASATPPGPGGAQEFSLALEHALACRPDGLVLFHLPEWAEIGRAALQVTDCGAVAWSPRETALSVVNDGGQIYVWRFGGTPYSVGQAMPGARAAWSPDSLRLAAADPSAAAAQGSFVIAYADGRPQRPSGAVIDAGDGWKPANLRWLSNTAIENVHRCVQGGNCQTHTYYDAQTGQYLIAYSVDSSSGLGQVGLRSPNERWAALETPERADEWDQRYSLDQPALMLYDLLTRRKRVWANSDGSVSFAFWNGRSTRLYFVRYPVDAPTIDPAQMPYGFLSLDAATLATRLIVPNVVLARWNSQRTLGLVVTADEIAPHQAQRLQAAIYTIDGRRVTAPQLLADQLQFERPQGLVAAAWSNAGDQVIFGDTQGNLWLQDARGRSRAVAAGLPAADWMPRSIYRWAPDDSRILVYRAGRAWMVAP